MSVEDPWRQFQEVVDAPWEWAHDWKQKTGRKVVGHLLPDVPEEIIHAAGALPVAVWGAGVQLSRAQTHIPSYTCSHAMGALEMGLRGDLDALDGMVIPYVCDTTRNLYHVWHRCFPKMATEFLRLPKRLDFNGAREYLRAEFLRLLNTMGGLTGTKVGLDELTAGNALYDQSRRRLREAYGMQLEQPAVWTQERVQLLFASSLKAPREAHLEWMDRLPWEKGRPDFAKRIRIYVRGKVWDPPGILGILDELGLLVVEDEIVTGWRSASKALARNGDPLEALVERHMSLVPYPGYHLEPAMMVESFLDRVRNSGAMGVIFLNPKFCEAAGFDTPDFQKALEAAGIPSLILETSSRGISLEQIRLRLEAFSELLSGDLP